MASLKDTKNLRNFLKKKTLDNAAKVIMQETVNQSQYSMSKNDLNNSRTFEDSKIQEIFKSIMK